MRILALDLATNTGVALGEPGAIPSCWTEQLGSAGDTHAARFSQGLLFIRQALRSYRPDLIVIEQPIAAGAKGGADRIFIAAGLRACIMGEARLASVRCREFAVATVRKHFIGTSRMNRTAAKSATIAECVRRGWIVANDNEADAAALWDLACAKSGFQVSPGGLFSQLERDDG